MKKDNNIFIKVAVVQMDFDPAVFIGINNLLYEPIKLFDGEPGHGIAYVSLSNILNKEELKLFVNNNIKDSYIALLNKKVENILMFCKDHKVDLVVFPEYSIPADTLPTIKDFVKDCKTEGQFINIVAGSHTVLSENYEIYKKIKMAISGDINDLLRKAISPIFHADGRVDHIEKHSRTQRMDHDFMPGESWKNIVFKIEGIDVTASIYLCIDFIEDKSPEKKDSKEDFLDADIIIVPSYTPVIGPFERLAKNYLTGYKKVIVFANAIDKGGSKVFCHFDPNTKQQLYNILDNGYGSFKLPEKDEGIIIVRFDMINQSSTKPTQLIPYDSSIQEGVFPFVYSYTLDQFEEIIKENVENESDVNKKKDILRANEEIIRGWGDHSTILKNKITFLYHNLDNLLDEQLEFFLSVFYLNNDIDLMDKWRLDMVNQITQFFDDILKSDRIEHKERELIYKMQLYYIQQRIRLEKNKIISKRNENIEELSKYIDKNILWVSPEEPENDILVRDFKKRFRFCKINAIKADKIKIITERDCDKIKQSTILIITITSSYNPFEQVKKEIKAYYNKCILIDYDNILGVNSIPREVEELKRDRDFVSNLKEKIDSILNSGK